MKKLNILIVEDNLLIAENISQVLSLAGYHVIASPTSGEDALVIAADKLPDVVLMDIHLAGKLDGIQTTEKLNAQQDLPVIYLTDFDDNQTMNRAKHTHPAAYRLKPFKERDLLNAIELAFFNASSGKEANPAQKFDFEKSAGYRMKDRIFVKKKDSLERVDITDILWIEADRAYFRIVTNTEEITLVGNLKEIESKLAHPQLMRIHRSHIVNIDKIIGILGNTLQIRRANKIISIQFSPAYKDAIFKHFQSL
jgi:DNA-binding LytR/AlgR family response regulator